MTEEYNKLGNETDSEYKQRIENEFRTAVLNAKPNKAFFMRFMGRKKYIQGLEFVETSTGVCADLWLAASNCGLLPLAYQRSKSRCDDLPLFLAEDYRYFIDVIEMNGNEQAWDWILKGKGCEPKWGVFKWVRTDPGNGREFHGWYMSDGILRGLEEGTYWLD